MVYVAYSSLNQPVQPKGTEKYGNPISYVGDSGGQNNLVTETFFYTAACATRTKVRFIHWTLMSLTTGSPPITEQLMFTIHFKGKQISYMWFTGVGSEHQIIEFNDPVYMDVGEVMAVSIHQLDGAPPYSLARALFGWYGLEVYYD